MVQFRVVTNCRDDGNAREFMAYISKVHVARVTQGKEKGGG